MGTNPCRFISLARGTDTSVMKLNMEMLLEEFMKCSLISKGVVITLCVRASIALLPSDEGMAFIDKTQNCPNMGWGARGQVGKW